MPGPPPDTEAPGRLGARKEDTPMSNPGLGSGTPASRVLRPWQGWREASARLALALLACVATGAVQAQQRYDNLDQAVNIMIQRIVKTGELRGQRVSVEADDFFEEETGFGLRPRLSGMLRAKCRTALTRNGVSRLEMVGSEEAWVLHGRWWRETRESREHLHLRLFIARPVEGDTPPQEHEGEAGLIPIDGAIKTAVKPTLRHWGDSVVRQLERDLPGTGSYRLHIPDFEVEGAAQPEHLSRLLHKRWLGAFTGSRRFRVVRSTGFDGELVGSVLVTEKRVVVDLHVQDAEEQVVAAAVVKPDKGLFPKRLFSPTVIPVVEQDEKVPDDTNSGGPDEKAPDDTNNGGHPARYALHRAAEAGNTNGLKAALADKAVDVNALDGKGWTALMHAVAKGYPTLVELLLAAKADPDIRAPDGATALFMAAADGHREIIVRLMEAGADVSIPGPKGRTAVDVARGRYSDVETARRGKEPLAVLALLQGMSLDDAAYARAEALGTASAYAEYRSSYPEGPHVEEAAERERERTAGRRFRDCAVCPELVVVPSGSFMMGSPVSEEGRRDSEGPEHRVTFGRPFAVGVYEVTFGEWGACVSGGGCAGHRPGDGDWGRGRRPVLNVSWDDAQGYVRWLSGETGEAYRLLSEAEWEYVARAGTRTRYWWGGAIGRNRANCRGCGSRWDGKQTAPVGSFTANAFGLHDVHGNVQEWVEDCWHGSYRGAPEDGSAWESGNCGRRVLRGGSWLNVPRTLRSANRNVITTGNRYNNAGFRVARTFTP